MKRNPPKAKERAALGATQTKASKPTRQKPAPEPIVAVQATSLKKDKLIRDSFTLPSEDFALIAVLKDRALDFKRPTKKSELLRAGLQQLASLDRAALRAALEALRPLKAGRPKNKP
ncbi:MAG: hypothetical protein ACREO0_15255 [Pseudoxanthomonas sp.]